MGVNAPISASKKRRSTLATRTSQWYNQIYYSGGTLERKDAGSGPGLLFHLEARWARRASWLGPAWAVLCGAVASGGLRAEGWVVLSLLLALFLADPLLGTIWWAAVTLASPNPALEGESREKIRLSPPPYTLPGSLAHRFFAWLEKRWAWWRGAVWPRFHGPLASLGFAIPLAFLAAILLGWKVVILTALAVCVAGLEALRRRAGLEKSHFLGALYGGGLAWLMGYFILASLAIQGTVLETIAGWLRGGEGKALLWAFLYTLALYAFQAIGAGQRGKGVSTLNLTQIGALAILLLAKEPVLAGAMGLLLLPQVLLQPALKRRGRGDWYLGRIQYFTMLGMMIGAVAVSR